MAATRHDPSLLIMCTADGMGQAEAPLRHQLIRTYLKLLVEGDTLPGAICFITDGVKLVVEGSPVLAELRAIEAAGVHLVVCKTCLDYFGLTDRIAVGIIGGMGDIIAAQWQAQKVVSI